MTSKQVSIYDLCVTYCFLFQTAAVILPALTAGLDLPRARGGTDLCPFTEA